MSLGNGNSTIVLARNNTHVAFGDGSNTLILSDEIFETAYHERVLPRCWRDEAERPKIETMRFP